MEHVGGLTFFPGLPTHEAIQCFLETLRNKRLLILGDSLSLQIFAGFLMLFKSHEVAMTPQDGNPFLKTNHIAIAENNASIRLIEFYRLASVDAIGVPLAPLRRDPQHFVLETDVLRAAVRESDVVIANIGLHYSVYRSYQYRMMAYLHELMAQEARDRSHFCFMWRSTLPQHFATTTGTGLYEDRILPIRDECPALNVSWSHGSDHVVSHVRAESGIPLIDLTSLLKAANMLHSLKSGDCTHLCYAPGLFAPMLTLFAEAIAQSCNAPPGIGRGERTRRGGGGHGQGRDEQEE